MAHVEGVAAAQSRISRLATLTPVHRAFHWLHLHQLQLRQWQMEMTAIPAPPFGEAARAAWFLERFEALGLSNVHLDEAGNALGELAGAGTDKSGPCVLLSAHLDTVFPAGTDCMPVEADGRLYGPGICDNAAGLTGLLAIGAALRFANITPPIPILFAANVGEEGEGDLRGMKYLFGQGVYRTRIAAAIALEGSGTSAVVTRALGSKRFRLSVTGPGGHSWSDAGVPNPILILSRALAAFDEIPLPETPRTTLNVGMISGGTSVNSIPESATALLDLRSSDREQLLTTESRLREVFTELLLQLPNLNGSSPQISLETIGDRPAAALPDDSSLLQTIRAVDRHLMLKTELRIGSTDANLPLSLGLPAVAMGTGGTGGGIHTLQEWYDPSGRETALRRILLTLLDTTQRAAG
ncbi:M20/M25/M40 family metallo-hydrolase [Granulicella arctica]|uniref:Acetylornithine deacetylase/succinyl-diaminopimelate desuccinylase-like protein n=1 Tax=Granulicella arctica TaxID=940613 RepID=A0A7Y9TTW7_9BACT|nr:M20/M25/M40 family metallo-hydrolase [Granulicella arctica]NYF80368.1 acetylornithine deacetylase/succinyl-diaminopimelate desuccinylase-like protein [Granulicella arctica]